ncbi:uncharacterized protein LOC141673433 [Apium graveolens]|uniref:uncharacterized protein LOC141673433 n=1 Tax=Apium graveolens TaxID=4045 RepID=UPI003D7BE04C
MSDGNNSNKHPHLCIIHILFTAINFLCSIEAQPFPNEKLVAINFLLRLYIFIMWLPYEMIDLVLCRVPVKPLLRFRCVCKEWCSLIDSNAFIKKHLKTSIECNTGGGLIINDDAGKIYMAGFDSLDDRSSAVVEISDPLKTVLAGAENFIAANGLVCAAKNEMSEIFLFNPSTRNARKLPSAPAEFPRSFHEVETSICGFGYDHVNDNYKVVKIAECQIQFHGFMVVVYSLKTNSWKRIHNVPSNIVFYLKWGVFASGALHWLASKNPGHCLETIVGFDLGPEQFKEVPFPALNKKYLERNHRSLVPVGESLCILDEYPFFSFDVWLMKEYGAENPWYKAFAVKQPGPLDFVNLRPLTFSKSRKDVLIEVDNAKLMWYDPKRKKSRMLGFVGFRVTSTLIYTPRVSEQRSEAKIRAPNATRRPFPIPSKFLLSEYYIHIYYATFVYMALPCDLIDEILCRLSVKYLLRCRCVSKEWCSLIDSDPFVKKHLRKSLECNAGGLLLNSGDGNFYLTEGYEANVDSGDDDNGVAVEIKDPLKALISGAHFVGAADGLVCVDKNTMNELLIFNPLTRKSREIPSAPAEFPRSLHITETSVCGFGYDGVNDDYKVVKVADCTRQFRGIMVIVYSLKTNSWKRIQNVPPTNTCVHGGDRAVFANGALHWLAFSNLTNWRQIVVCFDLGFEQFKEVPCPPIEGSFGTRTLVSDVESLYIVDNHPDSHSNVWLMINHSGAETFWSKALSVEQHSVLGSLVEERSIIRGSFRFFKPVSFSKSGESVLIEVGVSVDRTKLVWYDLKRKTVKNVKIRGIPNSFESHEYTESLIQLTGEKPLQRPSQDKPDKQQQRKRNALVKVEK